MNPLTQFKIFKKTPILPLLISLALAAFASPTVMRADAVTDWNAIASNSIVTTAGQPPQVSALSFAMVQGAVYDAVNAIDRGYQPYLVQPPSQPTDSKEAAAATAAFRVLVGFADLPGLFPSQLPTLQPQYDAYIAGLPDNPPGSRAAGESRIPGGRRREARSAHASAALCTATGDHDVDARRGASDLLGRREERAASAVNT